MTISVITPSYQQGQFIERTINSVLMQQGVELEYIVVDGGSTDDTLAILTHYQSQLTVISEPDEGQTAALNKGLRLASGDIIGWLNSDDIYYPNALKIVRDYFAKNTSVDIIYGLANNIDERDRVIDSYPVQPWNFSKLKQCCYIAQPAVFFRRSLLNEIGYFDETLHYCMDYEYWIRLAKHPVTMVYLPLVLAANRVHGATKTKSQSMAMQNEVIHMLKKQLGYVPQRWFLTYAYASVRTQNQFSISDPRFMILLVMVAAKTALLEHGWLRGSIDVLQFPWLLVKMSYQKYRRDCRS